MKLNYKEFGEGNQPLIIIHGLFGSLDNWLTIGKAFAKTHKIFLIDQRNHGKSPHDEEFCYQAMVADLKEFIEDQHLEKVSILGHSMGGKTAMLFAVLHPELLEKLIIVDIGPKYYAPHHQTIIKALTSFDLATLKSRGEADKIMAQTITDVSIRQFLLKNLGRNEAKQFEWKINLPVIVKHINNVGEGLADEANFGGSTMFIRGDRSDYILDEDMDAIQQKFPNAQLVTIQGAGHWVHAEQPEALYNAVTNFLGE